MRLATRKYIFSQWLFVAAFIAAFLAFTASAQDKTPIIIIPGITGSELINNKTQEVVWFTAGRSKDDDLTLPITADPLRSRDSLVPGDIIREVKLAFFARDKVYGPLIESLTEKGGYHEESWTKPSRNAAENSIFVFPYDWRLDNVHNAQILMGKIDRLKRTLKRPDLKFNVVAHSMGGIIARYAAMYGAADLPVGNRSPQPSWAGAKYFNKIVLIGTPNEGSVNSIGTLLNGFTIGGININLPFIRNLSKFDLFTIPSAYQLLPAPGTLRALDSNLEPLNIDLYDPKDWSKYGWNVVKDKGFARYFTAAEVRAAPAYFARALDRARRLHEALSAGGKKNPSISFHIVGAECQQTLDSIVLVRDPKTDEWRTLFKPENIDKRSREKVSESELRKIMLGVGDGVVTKRSLESDTQAKLAGTTSFLNPDSEKFICDEHSKLPSNVEVQDYLIGMLIGSVVPAVADDFRDKTWRWKGKVTSDGETLVPENETYRLQLTKEGTVAVRVACNEGTGTYKVSGDSIKFSRIVSTKKGCRNSTLAGKFLGGLANADSISVKDDELIVNLAGDAGIMKFTKD